MVWSVYGLLGVLLVGYLGSLLAPGHHSRSFIDGWPVVGFEFAASLLCIGLALGRKHGRAVPLVLGCALLSWTTGDSILTYRTLQAVGGGSPSAPSLADGFYLAFYPLAYVGLVLIMRRQVRQMVPATWLDGLVAGLGAAAVLACFAFNTIVHSVGGDPMAVAVNLAYPVGDLLLLVLVVGGTATFPGRPKMQWIVLACACTTIAVGDTFSLFQTSGHVSPIGSVLNGIAWPTTIFLVSASMWLRPSPVDLLVRRKTPGFLLPGTGAVCGLAVLFAGTQEKITPIAVGLASLTLAIVGVRAAFSVKRLRELTEERHRQSVTDDLTGLGNRRRLFSVLDAYFSDHRDPRTPHRRLAFLFVDLDHFKEINDSFGHSAGDALLRQLGPRLRGALRSSDLLVRVGGDELGVIITGGEPGYAIAVAERLLAKLREPFHLDSVSVHISASIGIAVAPTDASDSAGLLRCADLAMYRAKLSHTPFELYDQEVDDEGNRLRLVDELRVAVEGGHFDLHYQPQLDLRTGMISTVEALLRWPHPRLGWVPPMDFLPLAEEAGLMRQLTTLILDKALAQCASWQREGRDLTVSVNISITNLLDPEFITIVQAQLARHQLTASSLILEITETTIIKDFEGCQAVIARLRALGLGVSIDDFGAGFTSLAYLGDLAVSELKLDRTFITSLDGGNGSDPALVRATVELGHALGLRVVAEGIEDSATLNLLTGVGCDLAQGYFIGRPVPANELNERPGFGLPARTVPALIAS